ncbi:uncharacterized protein A4U43_C10F17860 [Asparagus officinalis]|uniref:C2H2-type domain-containing protein n=1 Tax=Asparagus officinalis TaxID=4686 RepID=A0A5P1E3J1_ASPOF|nr:uncharacterized protein A4U43_C10F17860 [Asparagus officinalis]
MAVFGIGGEEIGQMKQQQQHPLNPAMARPLLKPPPRQQLLPSQIELLSLPDRLRLQIRTRSGGAVAKTLMATNRFLCEVCGEGFQREQNLQLHRRGHNLPWKLKQRNPRDAGRRKVYLCPEPTCVHHDPSRAHRRPDGDQKHFSRKHGEKKWKCDKCSKKYAVQSDWKPRQDLRHPRSTHCTAATALLQVTYARSGSIGRSVG